MQALVIYESMFGNTKAVAEAIADGIVSARVVSVDQAPTEVPADIGLVVVGGPTHAFGMSRESTRADAVRQGADASTSVTRGLRDWVHDVSAASDTGFATFDTRVERAGWLSGSAARKAGRQLRQRGFRLVAKPQSFYVTGSPGPLSDGQQDAARRWGRSLVAATGSELTR
jgi:flavodoxin